MTTARETLEKAERLAADCRHGDMAAFDELVLIFREPVFNMAFGMLNNYEAACDAAQEVFVKVFKAINTFKGNSAFSTWLYAVAANTIRSHARAKRRRAAFEVVSADAPRAPDEPPAEYAAPDRASNPARLAEQNEIMAAVRAAVAALPEAFAQVIVMKDMQDMQYEEIAAALGCSLGTVKSRLSRAREMVKRKIGHLL